MKTTELVGSAISFGKAVDFLKEGKLVARKNWNGKSMYLLLVLGNTVKEAIDATYGSGTGDDELALPVLDAIYMKTATNELVPWLASQTDILSNDWYEVKLVEELLEI